MFLGEDELETLATVATSKCKDFTNVSHSCSKLSVKLEILYLWDAVNRRSNNNSTQLLSTQLLATQLNCSQLNSIARNLTQLLSINSITRNSTQLLSTQLNCSQLNSITLNSTQLLSTQLTIVVWLQWIECMSFDPTGDFLAVGSHDKKIHVYDVTGAADGEVKKVRL